METEYKIDIEPKWVDVLRLALGSPNPMAYYDSLKGAMETVDLIRQSQKEGKKSVTFVFVDKKKVNVEVK